MTADEYRECLRAIGLTPSRPSYDGATIHQDANGQFMSVPDPETLSVDERVSMVELLKWRLGISNN